MLNAKSSFLFVLLSYLSRQAVATFSFDRADYAHGDVIETDVAVIGGGSAGCYTAVRLQDYNKSVVVVERNNYLGGHAETYIDPQTGIPINLGVIVFPQTKTARDYFNRFGFATDVLKFSGQETDFVDFSTNSVVNFNPPNAADTAAALKAYAVQLAKYPSVQGGFDLTYPVATDLLLPFGTFLTKYNLSSLAFSTFQTCQGYSPLLNITTLYMLKYLNANLLGSYANGFLTAASHDTGTLYTKILAYLGPRALLETNVVAMDRSSPSQVKIVTRSTSKSRPGLKLILAKKLVSTPPPKPDQLTNYDLTSSETDLFTQFFDNGYYVGVLNNTGLNLSISYSSVDPHQPFSLPVLPGIYSVSPTEGTDLVSVFYGSPTPLPIAQVQADILTKVKDLAIAQGASKTTTDPEIVAFTNHAPFNLMVSQEAIAAGFYRELYSLQGQRNTFWNGAAWQAQDSGSIWEFTESHVLPKMLASLS